MKRIEIHLTEEETTTLDQIAVRDGRSRKNLCETEIRKLIKERGQKIKTATENVDTKH
jgi:metal-responsive CopG/Arc/MetJ family transcriptional regulator